MIRTGDYLFDYAGVRGNYCSGRLSGSSVRGPVPALGQVQWDAPRSESSPHFTDNIFKCVQRVRGMG